MGEAYILSAVRTPVGKAFKGTLKHTRPDEMAAKVIEEALTRVPGLEGQEIDDVVMGCAMPEAEQGLNVARISSLRAGLPKEVPGLTINRFCASGLEAINYAAMRIRLGQASVIVAGGVESMSLIPMGGYKVAPNPHLVGEYPEVYMSMGLTAERVAKKFGISREDQDHFALSSHEKAVAAVKEKRFGEEIIPLMVRDTVVGENGRADEKEILFEHDEGPREDTSFEALSSLKPAFKVNGTVTAGNSSQMSDGACALVLSGEKVAKKLGAEPLGRFVCYATAGVEPELMGIGPVRAIPKALSLAGLKLFDMGLIELNEAFASQSLFVLRELGLPEGRVNVSGGAIALGHPLGCTGAKLACTILYEMKRRGVDYGLVSMCVGGGMGAAGIFQRVKKL